jgi:hypothetical protein
MIAPGNYLAKPNGQFSGAFSYHVVNQDGRDGLAGWRDTNHDGSFSEAERAASERRGDRLTSVLFHPGTSGAPVSIGCQTLSPTAYAAFDAMIGQRGFSYTLVDATQASGS